MGESIVDVSRYEDKMGEISISKAGFEVSVSFGRFENDSLSWEKWLSFSPNKYLEKVEKCAAPGSVAKKAAYFEAHYKKIVVHRANQHGGDLDGNVSGAGSESDISNIHNLAEVVMQETNLISEVFSTHVDDLKEDAATSIECQRLVSEGVRDELDSRLDSPKSRKPENSVLVKEEEEEEGTNSVESQDMNPISHKCNNERDVTRVKKKVGLLVPKASHISTPKVSKPSPTFTALSASRPSTKKGNYSSLPRNKNPSIQERKFAPTSLHMSLSLDLTNSDPTSLHMTRKSFIMEKMGDKDIVKRAFKTFQKSINQSTSTSERDLLLLKASSMDKKSAKPAPTFGLKSDERAEKKKRYTLNPSPTQHTRKKKKSFITGSKDWPSIEIKELNFKATPLPTFFGGLKMLKNISDKQMLP
ncbi:hypothetical protein I3843_05G133900 [Carya illinoinensis]|nr:hypothetical protein I3843_05G133900 [Carya illinoinensis]